MKNQTVAAHKLSMTQSKKHAWFIVVGIVDSFILGYLWGALGERGLWADATGAGGYTTTFEFLLMGFVLLSFISVVVWCLNNRH